MAPQVTQRHFNAYIEDVRRRVKWTFFLAWAFAGISGGLAVVACALVLSGAVGYGLGAATIGLITGAGTVKLRGGYQDEKKEYREIIGFER